MELEQPLGDSAAVVETAPADTLGDANEVQFDEATGLPLVQEVATEDADIEEELDGVKLRGKKEALERVKSERLMQADYTRKTQEVAETRKGLEAREVQFQQAAQSHQQYIREVAQLVNVDEKLALFAKADWDQLTTDDPVKALRLHTEFTQLQAQKSQLVNTLTQKQQEARQNQQRETAKQVMDARTVLQRDIKGWSPELAGKLEDYGKSLGFDEAAMSNITNPTIVKMLHKAYLFDQLEKQRAVKAPPAAPAPPATRLNGSAAVSTKEPAQMSDAEFAAWRRRQIAQRR